MMEKLTPLDLLGVRARELDEAQKRYDEAYHHCLKSSCSRQAIGRALGVSGTAVTAYAKRRGWLT